MLIFLQGLNVKVHETHNHKKGNLTEGERLSTFDLLVLTSLDQPLYILKLHLNEEVNCIEPSLLVRFP